MGTAWSVSDGSLSTAWSVIETCLELPSLYLMAAWALPVLKGIVLLGTAWSVLTAVWVLPGL